MGAFDTYAATVACPGCGERHALAGQTRFFLPDFGGLQGRHFVVGSPQPLDFAVAELATARVWDDSWWRVREPGRAGEFTLLADFDEMFTCGCGAWLAELLRFRVREGPPASAELVELRLLDLRTADLAAEVDFADGEQLLWDGELAAFRDEMTRFAAAPRAERLAQLQAAISRRFAWTPGPTAASEPPWTCVVGEARCEGCGALQAGGELVLLSHPDYPVSFFGPAWLGGDLGPGTRVDCDLAWLAGDVDRGYFTRLRHPVPGDRLTLIARKRRRGCRCGVGFGAYVLYFAREPGGLRLERVGVRVVRGAEDVADIDFAEAPWVTRDPPARAFPRQWEWTRDGALERVLAELVD